MIRSNFSKDPLTAIGRASLSDYDTTGAMTYIIVVILWYSIGVVLMLAMQMSSRSEETEDSVRRRTRLLIRNLRDHHNTKEILEELANKQNRARLWDIYLGTNTKNRLALVENVRIRHIEKRLATIKRNHRLTHETLFSSTNTNTPYLHSRSEYQSDGEEETSSIHRRRSSLDQQKLDRWKQLASQSKLREQLPWNIRKIMIRRSFRRILKQSVTPKLRHPETAAITVDDEQTDFISFAKPASKLSRGHTEVNLSTIPSTIDKRQNPYLSYFYIPSTTLTPQFLLE